MKIKLMKKWFGRVWKLCEDWSFGYTATGSTGRELDLEMLSCKPLAFSAAVGVNCELPPPPGTMEISPLRFSRGGEIDQEVGYGGGAH